MAHSKMNWAIPVMRLGYAGRGVTYVAVAGISLWTIWQGGAAQGTSATLKSIETSPFGMLILSAIGIGLLCYTGWRVLDGIADLEEEGDDASGWIARGGMIVTGLLHAAIGFAALALVIGRGGESGDTSQIEQATRIVMAAPLGIWLIGAAGLATLGAGLYYLHKAWSQSYLTKLAANHFTTHWNGLLRTGVAAQGVVIIIISGFLIYAFWTHNPQQAGGLGQTFSWLSDQIYGQVLVTFLCLGLLGFALFLFVNALYRVVPRLSDPDLRTVENAVR